jgi:UPF0755 protein
MIVVKEQLQTLLNFLKALSNKKKLQYSAIFLFVVIVLLIVGPWSATYNFPIYTTIHIEKGTSLSQTATILEEQNYIRSNFWFKVFAVLYGGSRSVIAGDYYFSINEGTISIAKRITHGEHGMVLIKVTIPEGLKTMEISNILKKRFSLFDANAFIKKAPEGYLFPDTYFFFPNINAEASIARMQDVFNTKTADIKAEAISKKRNFANIVVMASILEEEVKTPTDMKIVSGILWKRMSIGMPLQVDSASTTYVSKGLPLVPISNPGLVSLDAALNPTETKYLYYLSDLKGKIYYAKDFEGHQINREKYLGK